MNDLLDKLRDIHHMLVELDGHLSGMKFNCCARYRECHKCLAYNSKECSYEHAMDKLENIIIKVNAYIEVIS
nr:MAG TPA: hypothetical protein [Caudoviricetes sp.]